MKTTTQNTLCPPNGATSRLIFGRAQSLFLTAALLAPAGLATTARADRVGHDVAAGNVTVTCTNIPGTTLPTDTGTELAVPVGVNSFGIINNHNISDHRMKIGDTETNDIDGGVLISAISENLRNNRGSNMTHTLSMSVVWGSRAYEVATQSEPLVNSSSVGSIEDNVNFASAWFPFSTWIGGSALNSTNGNPGVVDTFIASPGLALGTHFFDGLTNSAVSDAAGNGTFYLDLRSLGIDSRRDGVLLVNHAKNEANYAGSAVCNSDDEMDGAWMIQVRDNRSGGVEADPLAFVFVPKSNTNVVSGMFLGDASIAMYSGSAPAFTVALLTNQYELKIPGRSPDDGVLIISPGFGGVYNGDNIVTYQANTARNGWIIQTRDLPACGAGTVGDTDVMCSFVFIPAEKPGVTVTPSKNLMTTEAGGTAEFTVTVNGYPKPTADVTLTLSSSDSTEGTVSPTILTFTTNEWNVPKTVTITGVDDADMDGTRPYTIILSALSSTDTNYNGLAPGNVGAINIDNEAGISLDASSITTTEAGGTATFSVWLNTAPTADVTLTLSSSDTTEATVSPSTLTFTPTDYSTPQQVTVTGVDDYVQDGPVSYFVVTAAASSADPVYNNADALDVSGQNLDNDTARVIVPADKVTVTESNSTATVALVLGSEPTANVTINCVSTDPTEGVVTPSVTFTPADWNVPQTVTITAVDDLVNDGTIAFSITTSVSSADPIYGAINPDDITVQTVDNEATFALPSGDFTYGIGEAAKGIDGYATVVDTDTADYSGGSLTVTITSGGSSSDRLDVRNTGTGTGEIGVSGSTVTYEGATIGTKSGGSGLSPLVIALTTGAASPAAAEALIRSVTYQNVDTNASPQTQTVSFTLADGVAGVSTATKKLITRLMRMDSYQQGADGGFGDYTGALDTQIYWEFPTTPYPAGYSSAGLWIDFNTSALTADDQPQCLIKFTNLVGTASGQIPSGAKVVFAELQMNVTDSGHGARFNRMLMDWDEGATWDSMGSGIQLDDVEAVSGTNAFLGDMANNTTTGSGLRRIGVTADVQAWVNGTNTFGWVMSVWINGDNGTAFSPCESTNVLLRPRLRVGWLPGESTSVATFCQGIDSYTNQVDTQIREVLPDTSYAASTTLSPDPQVNSTPIPNQQQVLVRFGDVIGSGLGQIPSGAKIHAAVLDLTSISADAQGAGGQFHQLLKSWDPTNTWNTWVGGISTDGVEAAGTATQTLPAAGFGEQVQATRHTIELTADVQAWANGTLNNGWVIMPWPEGGNGWAFSTAEWAIADMRPQLRVYYTAVPVIEMLYPVITSTNVQVRFTGAAGTAYSVLRSATADAAIGTWTVLGTATTDSTGAGTFQDNSPLPSGAFYRVRNP